MKNNQIHIEIPADDIERAKKFYTELFGWEITKFDMPESGMDYWGINIAGECKDQPNISGGLMKRQNTEHQITNYTVVDSVTESLEKIEKSGGKIIMPIMEVPTVGKFSVFSDTEGNVSAVWENNVECVEKCEKTENKSEKPNTNKKNSSIHFEIPADDVERAKSFYENVYGWKIDKVEMEGCDMNYWGVNVTGEDRKKTKPSVCGGLMKRKNEAQKGILNYVVVNDEVETFVPEIEKLGGKIIVPVTEIPKVGKFVIFQDSERNTLAIWKCNTECKENC